MKYRTLDKEKTALQYFFKNSRDFLAMEEQGIYLGFDLYSPKHLIWLAAIAAAAWLISGWYKGLGGQQDGSRKQRQVRRIFAVVIVLSEIYKDSVLAMTGNFRVDYLPFHLCSFAIFAMAADAFAEKQRVSGQLIAYAFMPGALMALLFCNWTEYPFWNFMNIHSFLFHGWIVCYGVMELRSGRIKPSYVGIWQTAGLLAALAVPVFAFNRIYGTNFLFLNEASEGSPLVILWELFGTKYGHPGNLAAAAILAIAVFHVLWLLYRLAGRRSIKKAEKNTCSEMQDVI